MLFEYLKIKDGLGDFVERDLSPIGIKTNGIYWNKTQYGLSYMSKVQE